MVDRITPVTSDADRASLAERHGIADRWPVVSETFTQWVIEDRFPQGRPAWEEVGAQFVADVAPYEFMKLRLLNTSHLAVSGMGRLIGYVTIDEAMADPAITRFMTALMDRETGPTLPPVPGIDLAAYKRTLVERFANTAIKDTVERVNTDAPLNVLVDPIRDRLARGRAAGPAGARAGRLAAPGTRRGRAGPADRRPPPAGRRCCAARRWRAARTRRRCSASPNCSATWGADPRLLRPVGRWLGALYRDGAKATLAQAAAELAF